MYLLIAFLLSTLNSFNMDWTLTVPTIGSGVLVAVAMGTLVCVGVEEGAVGMIVGLVVGVDDGIGAALVGTGVGARVGIRVG